MRFVLAAIFALAAGTAYSKEPPRPHPSEFPNRIVTHFAYICKPQGGTDVPSFSFIVGTVSQAKLPLTVIFVGKQTRLLSKDTIGTPRALERAAHSDAHGNILVRYVTMQSQVEFFISAQRNRKNVHEGWMWLDIEYNSTKLKFPILCESQRHK